MLQANLDPYQKAIIRDICNKQVKSLLRVYKEEPMADEKITSLLISFDRLKEKPSKLLQLDSDSLSLFKHNLFNIDYSHTRLNLKDAIASLWKQIFISEYWIIKPS